MRTFTAFCLACAVVLGAAFSSPSVSFGCGGMGQTGCKVASSPILPTLRLLISLWDVAMP